MEFLKSISGRIVTGLVALGVVAAAISWWQMDESTRQTLVAGTGRILAWFGVMLAWPWVSFAIIARVARMESNLAGGVLVGAYTLAEVVLLAWLFHWHMPNATAWTFLVLGGLVSGVYNILVCDWIAEKV
jgi:FtsH-binding integral membrane protein